MAKYIWQSASWPKFKIDYENLLPKLSRCHALQGQLIQQGTSLGIDLDLAAQLESLTQEALKTAEIEGEYYNPDAVRSSIARRLGLPTAGLPSDRQCLVLSLLSPLFQCQGLTPFVCQGISVTESA